VGRGVLRNVRKTDFRQHLWKDYSDGGGSASSEHARGRVQGWTMSQHKQALTTRCCSREESVNYKGENQGAQRHMLRLGRVRKKGWSSFLKGREEGGGGCRGSQTVSF